MSNAGNSLLHGIIGAGLLAAAGPVGWSYYKNTERPLPVHLRPYDNNRVPGITEKKDGRLDSTECMAVAADFIDVNHDGIIDEKEYREDGGRIIAELRNALGRNNFSSAAQLERTIDRIHNAPRVLSEWQSAVNKAKLNKKEKTCD